jgi:hypothetical protein
MDDETENGSETNKDHQDTEEDARALEVEPDPKRGPTEAFKPPGATEDDVGVDDDDIVAICNHQKYANKDHYQYANKDHCQLLLEFKSSWRVWGDGKAAYEDIQYYKREELLNEYLKNNGIMMEHLGIELPKSKIVVEPESDSDESSVEEELI